MSKRWEAYALHVLDSTAKVNRILTRGSPRHDGILYDALLRNLQTLAEATQRLPDSIKDSYAGIPWQDIAGFRNILVHNYLGDIDVETVMRVVEHELRPLEAAVRSMLDDRR